MYVCCQVLQWSCTQLITRASMPGFLFSEGWILFFLVRKASFFRLNVISFSAHLGFCLWTFCFYMWGRGGDSPFLYQFIPLRRIWFLSFCFWRICLSHGFAIVLRFLCALICLFAFTTLAVEVSGIILQVEFSCILLYCRLISHVLHCTVSCIISMYYIDGRQELYCWRLALLGAAFFGFRALR